MVLVVDPIGSPLLLLRSQRAKSLDIDQLLLAADEPVRIYYFGRLSGMKKVALEKFVPKCDIFFKSLKPIKSTERWGWLYENITETIHYEKISYTIIPKNKKNQRFSRLD